MRVLGVDLGAVRVGIAVSDPSGTLASPVTVLRRSPGLHDEIAGLVEGLEATAVVVGLPRSLDGRERQAARTVRAEVRVLEQRLAVPVHVQDERLTTVAAHAGLAAAGRSARQRRGSVDASAAAVLLQSWLDSPAGRRPEEDRKG